MRKMWLENIKTKLIWDCMPPEPYKTSGGCFFAEPRNMGYSQGVTQKQIDVDYFIQQIQSENLEPIVTAYFNGNEHFKNFVDFVGDFTESMYLYYSPDGSIEPYDRISKPFYKPVVISFIDKPEMTTAGWYICEIRFKAQSDVWRKDYLYSITHREVTAETVNAFEEYITKENIGTIIHYTGPTEGALVHDKYYQVLQDGTGVTYREVYNNILLYPYTYPYVFSGENTLTITIDNQGRSTGCIVKITNNAKSVISNAEWYAEHVVIDRYGQAITEVQRAKFFSTLQTGYSLYVDSNYTTQEAKIIFSDGTAQSVVSQQEPSWNYINFIRLKHGTNRLVFFVANKDVKIEVQYAELREVV